MSESNYESTNQSTATTNVAIFDSSTMYWKLCTVLLGIGFVIAIASHGGPSAAHASEYGTDSNLLSIHQRQAAASQEADAMQSLSIGGFGSVDGQAAFVIVNTEGQRVGTLPMSAVND